MDKSRLPPRHFITVARIIKNLVPKEHETFHLSINSIVESARYCAPETTGFMWTRMVEILEDFYAEIKEENSFIAKVLISIINDCELEDVKLPE